MWTSSLISRMTSTVSWDTSPLGPALMSHCLSDVLRLGFSRPTCSQRSLQQRLRYASHSMRGSGVSRCVKLLPADLSLYIQYNTSRSCRWKKRRNLNYSGFMDLHLALWSRFMFEPFLIIFKNQTFFLTHFY